MATVHLVCMCVIVVFIVINVTGTHGRGALIYKTQNVTNLGIQNASGPCDPRVPCRRFEKQGDPGDCNKYYICNSGMDKWEPRSCGAGRFFSVRMRNHDRLFCMASRDDCQGPCPTTPKYTGTPFTPTPQKPSTCDDVPIPCVQWEHYPCRDHADCGKYFECHRQKLELKKCGAGYLFDINKKQCVTGKDIDEVDCDYRCVTPGPTTATSIVSSRPYGPCDQQLPCRPLHLQGDPSDCSTYFECLNGNQWNQQKCPLGTFFDVALKRCHYTARCQGSCVYHSAPCNTTIPCSQWSLQGDPKDCTNYFECIQGTRLVRRSCPQGTLFDVELKRCHTRAVCQGLCEM